MRAGLLLMAGLMLTACGDDDDLTRYVAEVKARPSRPPDPLPPMKEYVPESYQPGTERSPFVQPRPENAKPPDRSSEACVRPGGEQPPGELERYSLDNLSLRGTLGDQKRLMALIRTQDGITHRVGMGQRLGLHHGEVVKITDNEVVLKEYIPDGHGCWENRETRLLLSEVK